VRPYFGEGDEFHLGFDFPVMPRIFMAMRQGDRTPLVWISERIPAIPENSQWCTFLRNHDELTLEMVTEQEREWMWREYAPDPRMRLNLGIRRRLAPLLDNDRRKIELANSLLFTLPGSPVLYYGDEIGMGDNIFLEDRDGVRTPMQWNGTFRAGFSLSDNQEFYLPLIRDAEYGPQNVNVAAQLADPGSLLNAIRRMIQVRKSSKALGWGSFRWIDIGDAALAVYLRECRGEAGMVLVINNLSGEQVHASTASLPQGNWRNSFNGQRLLVGPQSMDTLEISAYGYLWFEG
jgi:maltose alpha-D-glucosyltransferase/alpha-amylase